MKRIKHLLIITFFVLLNSIILSQDNEGNVMIEPDTLTIGANGIQDTAFVIKNISNAQNLIHWEVNSTSIGSFVTIRSENQSDTLAQNKVDTLRIEIEANPKASERSDTIIVISRENPNDTSFETDNLIIIQEAASPLLTVNDNENDFKIDDLVSDSSSFNLVIKNDSTGLMDWHILMDSTSFLSFHNPIDSVGALTSKQVNTVKINYSSNDEESERSDTLIVKSDSTGQRIYIEVIQPQKPILSIVEDTVRVDSLGGDSSFTVKNIGGDILKWWSEYKVDPDSMINYMYQGGNLSTDESYTFTFSYETNLTIHERSAKIYIKSSKEQGDQRDSVTIIQSAAKPILTVNDSLETVSIKGLSSNSDFVSLVIKNAGTGLMDWKIEETEDPNEFISLPVKNSGELEGNTIDTINIDYSENILNTQREAKLKVSSDSTETNITISVKQNGAGVDKPILISPKNEYYTGAKPTFKWQVNNAYDSYILQITGDHLSDDISYPTNQTEHKFTDYSFVPGLYEWKVIGKYGNVIIDSSEVREFTVFDNNDIQGLLEKINFEINGSEINIDNSSLSYSTGQTLRIINQNNLDNSLEIKFQYRFGGESWIKYSNAINLNKNNGLLLKANLQDNSDLNIRKYQLLDDVFIAWKGDYNYSITIPKSEPSENGINTIWHFFSVPGAINVSELNKDLGAQGEKSWRLYRWESKYELESDFISSNQSYFIAQAVVSPSYVLSKTFQNFWSRSLLDTTLSLNGSGKYKTVSNPFTFAVNIMDTSTVVWEYNSTFTPVNVLEPNKGYFVIGNTNELLISTDGNNKNNKLNLPPVFYDAEWVLKVKAENGNKTLTNYLSLHSDSQKNSLNKSGETEYIKFPRPPSLDDDFNIYFSNTKDNEKSAILKAYDDEGFVWDLVIESATYSGNIDISTQLVGELPTDVNYLIWDTSENKEIKTENFSVSISKGQSQLIKIYAGSESFIHNKLKSDLENIPNNYSLDQNYPNPFNPSTQIRFSVKEENHTELVIYNLLGQKVATLVSENKIPGHYQVEWKGKTDNGIAVSSGIYFYRITSGNFVDTKKMILIR